VLPHQWERVGEQFIRHRPPKSSHVVEDVSDIGRVPIYDGRNRQVEAGGAKLLSLLSSVRDAALFEGADHLRQRMALLAFVQAGLAKLSELGRFQPIQHEQRSFNASQLARSKIGEGGRKTCGPVYLVQQFGDANAGHHSLDLIREGSGLRCGCGLHRRHNHAAVIEFDSFKIAPLSSAREVLQPPIEFLAPCRKPLVRGGGQFEFRGGGDRHCRQLSVKRTLNGHLRNVRKSWTSDGKADSVVTGRENGHSTLAHVGYMRVSTIDQNPALQFDALAAAGCAKVFEDRAAGARSDQSGLRLALEYVRDGDVLIVWKPGVSAALCRI
jgi:hypothetical protein